ncbi:RNA polymerase sigma-70 factor, ECF subfamily [Pelagerythrobacter marensis]|uniref:RNA polymerase sigma-70 factor, ECF subfamily n=1 Tax=Pelagerythrobacter marensis TaxID=543877 RepID=A0A0G3X983_9SPHN|nr:sigma-70 family RNA polymerase sigma factor [Pelagerythrobacter marensis]AKM07757.1 RNA polymerase sigma-70 factor, ECF subfamily [Pelagerythrobacter marensis]
MGHSLPDTIRHLKHVLRRRGVRGTDSEDLIQDAFDRLARYRRTKQVDNEQGFLVRTVINLSIDAMRKRRRLDQHLETDGPDLASIADESPLQDEVFAARERLSRLEEGFSALDPVTRAMLRARRVDGMAIAQIAARHGCSVSTVEKRLAKAVLFLTDWMEGW